MADLTSAVENRRRRLFAKREEFGTKDHLGACVSAVGCGRTSSSVRPRREPLHLCFRRLLLLGVVSCAFGVDSIGSGDRQYCVA